MDTARNPHNLKLEPNFQVRMTSEYSQCPYTANIDVRQLVMIKHCTKLHSTQQLNGLRCCMRQNYHASGEPKAQTVAHIAERIASIGLEESPNAAL